MLQSLGLAADMMGSAVSTANTAWQENIALTNEANKRYATTESQQAMMANAANNLAVVYGELYTPALREAYGVGTDLLVQAADFVEENPEIVKGVTTFVGVVGTATAGVTAFTAAQVAARAASAAFSKATAVALGPIALGITAVGALAGVAVMLASAYDEANISVGELTETAHGTTEAIGEVQAEFDATAQSTLATAQVADSYITKLEELEAAGLETDEAQRQYHNTLLLLTNAVPELSDLIDTQTDSIEGGTAALRANAQAWEEQAKAQAYQDYMSGVMEQYNAVMEEAAANEMELTKAQIQAETAAKGMDAAYQSILKTLGMTDEQFKATYGSVDNLNSINTGLDMVSTGLLDLQNQYVEYRDELGQAQDAEELYQAALDEGNGALEEAQTAIDEASAAYDRLTESTSGTGDAVGEGAEQINSALSNVNSTVQELADSYNEAYEAALGSIEGQYSLWDEAAAVSETSIGSINSALQSQIDYWNQYNENLASLNDRAADIEGLSELLATFADGSASSVSAIAGMVNASDEDLQQMVESYAQLQQAQQDTSDSLADLTTGFSNQMDELQASLVEDIAAMDLSEEARQSGIATIQGYISAAGSMRGQVAAAYADLGSVATSALQGNKTSRRGYAAGTMDAEAGVHLVGEYGPELVAFRGGESVLTTARTQEVLSAGRSAVEAIPTSTTQTFQFSLSPSYSFTGTQSREDMDAAFQRQNENLRVLILDVVREAQFDSQRRAF